MVSMLEDRIPSLKQIYAPSKVGPKQSKKSDGSFGHPNMTRSRMAAYRAPSATPSVFSQSRSRAGRSPRMELLNDVREEMLQAKKYCAKLIQENTVLKTRLLKLSAHSGKREHHLQRLLYNNTFEPAESFDTNEAITLASMKQRLIKSEAQVKHQQDVIQSIDDVLAQYNRLVEKYSSLKKENKFLRQRIAQIESLGENEEELHDWTKEDLIRLVNKLEMKALKAPIRAAVATLQVWLCAQTMFQEKTEVGKLLKELKDISDRLQNTQQENEGLKSEIGDLLKELEHARIVQKEERPPGFGVGFKHEQFRVPPLNMTSIDVSESVDEDSNPEEFSEKTQGDNDLTAYGNLDLVALEIFEHVKAHAARLESEFANK